MYIYTYICHMYIYIHIYIHICMYIYIGIRSDPRNVCQKVTLWTYLTQVYPFHLQMFTSSKNAEKMGVWLENIKVGQNWPATKGILASIYSTIYIYICIYIILYILPRKTGTHTAKMELLNASDSVAAHYNSLMVPIPRRFQRPRPGSVRAATANLETKLETVQEMPQLYVVHPWCP